MLTPQVKFCNFVIASCNYHENKKYSFSAESSAIEEKRSKGKPKTNQAGTEGIKS